MKDAKKNNIKNLIYASSSSIYGESKSKYFKENELASTPIQLYAATKRSNELMAYAYSSLYKIKTIGLRFFFYGPWGRPDMSLFLFTKKIINNQHIKVFNKVIITGILLILMILLKEFIFMKKMHKKIIKKKLIEIFNIAGGKT